MSAPPSGSPDVMAVAIAPAALSDKQSPGDSVVRSLPQYGILPDTAIGGQGEGSMRFSFNTRMCSWQEMGKKSINGRLESSGGLNLGDAQFMALCSHLSTSAIM